MSNKTALKNLNVINSKSHRCPTIYEDEDENPFREYLNYREKGGDFTKFYTKRFKKYFGPSYSTSMARNFMDGAMISMAEYLNNEISVLKKEHFNIVDMGARDFDDSQKAFVKLRSEMRIKLNKKLAHFEKRMTEKTNGKFDDLAEKMTENMMPNKVMEDFEEQITEKVIEKCGEDLTKLESLIKDGIVDDCNREMCRQTQKTKSEILVQEARILNMERDLNNEITSLKEETESLKKENESLKKETASLRKENVTTKQSFEDVKKEVTTLHEEINTIKKELNPSKKGWIW